MPVQRFPLPVRPGPAGNVRPEYSLDAGGLMPRLTRRQFLHDSARSAAAVTLLSAATGKAAASERVRLCLVGVRGRGRKLVTNFAGLKDVQITHLCDVNRDVFGPVAKDVTAIQKT